MGILGWSLGGKVRKEILKGEVGIYLLTHVCTRALL